MRNHALTILGLALIVPTIHAQHGKVFDELTLKSKILKMERKYAIYLPPDYDLSERSYPILYLLHGLSDNQTGWVQFGEVQHIADKAIQSGKATPMIIAMPDADTNIIGYNNTIDGQWNYEDFFFDEFMPHVEDKFRVRKDKRFRAVGGLSMGGGGALIYALHRPDLFSACVPLSAWFGPSSVEALDATLKTQNIYATSNELEEYFQTYNALAFIEGKTKEYLEQVEWHIDCGDEDIFSSDNSLLHIALKQKNVTHEFRIRDGNHSWSYWRESLPELIYFVSQRFHQF